MSETPQEHVDRVQRELADAKVAALQAELAQAQHAAANQPPGVPPGAMQEPPPGWQPAVGSDGPVYATVAPPFPADQRSEFLQSVLRQVQDAGGRTYVNGSFGMPNRSNGSDPAPDRSLAPPPRRVPLSFRAAMLPWKWWDAFTLFMVAVTPIALWISFPAAAPAAGLATFLVLCWLRLRGVRTRLRLLKWGVVAQVRSAGPVGVGTYYSGTTYRNVRLPVAHGWHVDRNWYSGPGYKTKIVYATGADEHTLTLHGREYVDGVILADSRDPARALCVSQFPYDLNRDEHGGWLPHVGAWLWIGSTLQAGLYLAWLAGSTYLATLYWPRLQ